MVLGEFSDRDKIEYEETYRIFVRMRWFEILRVQTCMTSTFVPLGNSTKMFSVLVIVVKKESVQIICVALVYNIQVLDIGWGCLLLIKEAKWYWCVDEKMDECEGECEAKFGGRDEKLPAKFDFMTFTE